MQMQCGTLRDGTGGVGARSSPYRASAGAGWSGLVPPAVHGTCAPTPGPSPEDLNPTSGLQKLDSASPGAPIDTVQSVLSQSGLDIWPRPGPAR
ncbi:hypothetical protein C8Q77DRAFT_199562 [Trametes polyzona]|nr:hypothetical protein C8Q77DRAFT_199562 [Trametes polyzona]